MMRLAELMRWSINENNGEAAKAVAVLEQFLVRRGDVLTPALLAVSPLWDRVRGDAAFEEFLARYRDVHRAGLSGSGE